MHTRYKPCFFAEGRIHHQVYSPLYDRVKRFNNPLQMYKFKNRTKVRDNYRGYSHCQKTFKKFSFMIWLDNDYYETNNLYVHVYNDFKDFSDFRFKINYVAQLED